jgi:dienelactone hydrolase
MLIRLSGTTMLCSIKSRASLFSWLVLLATALSSHAENISLDSTNEGGNSLFSGELLETSCTRIGVVMYHGRGASPTGPVVEEMRLSLNRAGYTTLSIDDPIPSNGQTDFASYVNEANPVFAEAYARARTAINYLQNRGVEQVVMAGFSLGSRLAAAHVARGQINELPIIGLIGVGMYGNSIDPLNVSSTLDEVDVPVLDLYGDVDTDAVNTAAARLAAYNSGAGLDYTQTSVICVSGLNCHQLEGLKGDDSMVLEVNINAWMQAVAPASQVPGCEPAITVADPVPATGSASGGGVLNAIFMSLFLLLLPLVRKIKVIGNT